MKPNFPTINLKNPSMDKDERLATEKRAMELIEYWSRT